MLTLDLLPGVYYYRYVIDDKWVLDPAGGLVQYQNELFNSINVQPITNPGVNSISLDFGQISRNQQPQAQGLGAGVRMEKIDENEERRGNQKIGAGVQNGNIDMKNRNNLRDVAGSDKENTQNPEFCQALLPSDPDSDLSDSSIKSNDNDRGRSVSLGDATQNNHNNHNNHNNNTMDNFNTFSECEAYSNSHPQSALQPSHPRKGSPIDLYGSLNNEDNVSGGQTDVMNAGRIVLATTSGNMTDLATTGYNTSQIDRNNLGGINCEDLFLKNRQNSLTNNQIDQKNAQNIKKSQQYHPVRYISQCPCCILDNICRSAEEPESGMTGVGDVRHIDGSNSMTGTNTTNTQTQTLNSNDNILSPIQQAQLWAQKYQKLNIKIAQSLAELNFLPECVYNLNLLKNIPICDEYFYQKNYAHLQSQRNYHNSSLFPLEYPQNDYDIDNMEDLYDQNVESTIMYPEMLTMRQYSASKSVFDFENDFFNTDLAIFQTMNRSKLVKNNFIHTIQDSPLQYQPRNDGCNDLVDDNNHNNNDNNNTSRNTGDDHSEPTPNEDSIRDDIYLITPMNSNTQPTAILNPSPQTNLYNFYQDFFIDPNIPNNTSPYLTISHFSPDTLRLYPDDDYTTRVPSLDELIAKDLSLVSPFLIHRLFLNDQQRQQVQQNQSALNNKSNVSLHSRMKYEQRRVRKGGKDGTKLNNSQHRDHNHLQHHHQSRIPHQSGQLTTPNSSDVRPSDGSRSSAGGKGNVGKNTHHHIDDRGGYDHAQADGRDINGMNDQGRIGNNNRDGFYDNDNYDDDDFDDEYDSDDSDDSDDEEVLFEALYSLQEHQNALLTQHTNDFKHINNTLQVTTSTVTPTVLKTSSNLPNHVVLNHVFLYSIMSSSTIAQNNSQNLTLVSTGGGGSSGNSGSAGADREQNLLLDHHVSTPLHHPHNNSQNNPNTPPYPASNQQSLLFSFEQRHQQQHQQHQQQHQQQQQQQQRRQSVLYTNPNLFPNYYNANNNNYIQALVYIEYNHRRVGGDYQTQQGTGQQYGNIDNFSTNLTKSVSSSTNTVAIIEPNFQNKITIFEEDPLYFPSHYFNLLYNLPTFGEDNNRTGKVSTGVGGVGGNLQGGDNKGVFGTHHHHHHHHGSSSSAQSSIPPPTSLLVSAMTQRIRKNKAYSHPPKYVTILYVTAKSLERKRSSDM
jgi:hypothetical protein